MYNRSENKSDAAPGCLMPHDCEDKRWFACEALKIDFDSKMLKKYERIFDDFNVTTGVMGENSPLVSGPLVDKTLYDGSFPVNDRLEVKFKGPGVAGQTSLHPKHPDFDAAAAFLGEGGKKWISKRYPRDGRPEREETAARHNFGCSTLLQ